MNNYICGEEKYKLFPATHTIFLPVGIKNLPKKMEVEGFSLILRSSFHISLVCIGKIIEKNNVSIPDFESKVLKDFCFFVKDNNISFLGFRNEFRFVSEDEKRSVIIMCDISNLDKFFYFLNNKYELNIEVPPTHITLYTLQPDIGIFITDLTDIKNMTELIENPIGYNL